MVVAMDAAGARTPETELRTDDEIPENVRHLIVASEVRVSALATRLLALTDAGCDTTETEERMWREVDALTTLRRQQFALHGLGDP